MNSSNQLLMTPTDVSVFQTIGTSCSTIFFFLLFILGANALLYMWASKTCHMIPETNCYASQQSSGLKWWSTEGNCVLEAGGVVCGTTMLWFCCKCQYSISASRMKFGNVRWTQITTLFSKTESLWDVEIKLSDTFEDMSIILLKPQKRDENCLYGVVT